MQRPVPGQRWISTSEPALGLGRVEEVEGNTARIRFPAAEETRLYALDSAPLVRVRFSVGDEVTGRDGTPFTVTAVDEDDGGDGLLVYRGDDHRLPEGELLDSLSFIRPEKRLLAGLTDHPRDFDLRLRAQAWNARIRRSSARGFRGARIDLIPHQLAIVAETAGRLQPRVLLADEVGLGKTIEACLILHRLHLTGRADRILVLVPEPLLHQWFVEMLRRFNLLFAIYDEGRCSSIEAHDPDANPFLDSQLILASTDFLANAPDRARQARDAGFDLLVVDEAHHLEWSAEEASPAYAAVEALAAIVPSLLLLTATPRQLGPEGHFARLRLLDPARYAGLDEFLAEAASYAPLAEVIEALEAGEIPADVGEFAARSPRAGSHLAALRAGDENARAPLVAELIDSFGTGRAFFRNTRDRLSGFPERRPILHPLPEGASPYRWLAGLLRELDEAEKVLLITHTPEAAMTVQERLLEQLHVESALFHEDLGLVQRDRNAAWFADPEGARILICSEIGSEGRNFQFAHHLVLFGLPRDPEVLEQRIGRLDRIGQTETIRIHVPYGVHSESERHARWLHEGLDAFSRPLKGATALAERLLPELEQLDPADPAGASGESAFEDFLARSRALRDEVAAELGRGHDRLLELGAPDPERSAELIEAIGQADADPRFERFVVRLFDHLGLDVTDLAPRCHLFRRGQRLSEAFAGLPEEGLSATFDRATALAREDLAFLTADHPLFRDALEQLLDGQTGNASFVHWKTGEGKGILLEAVFVLEVLAPNRLHLDRFLPPTPVRVVIDHRGDEFAGKLAPARLQPGDPRPLVGQDRFRREILPAMLEAARTLAGTRAASHSCQAAGAAREAFERDIQRLEDLATRNPGIRPGEIEALRVAARETAAALDSTRLRLDAIRLVWRS